MATASCIRDGHRFRGVGEEAQLCYPHRTLSLRCLSRWFRAALVSPASCSASPRSSLTDRSRDHVEGHSPPATPWRARSTSSSLTAIPIDRGLVRHRENQGRQGSTPRSSTASSSSSALENPVMVMGIKLTSESKSPTASKSNSNWATAQGGRGFGIAVFSPAHRILGKGLHDELEREGVPSLRASRPAD